MVLYIWWPVMLVAFLAVTPQCKILHRTDGQIEDYNQKNNFKRDLATY